jgi:hypothetical protein
MGPGARPPLSAIAVTGVSLEGPDEVGQVCLGMLAGPVAFPFVECGTLKGACRTGASFVI